MAKANHRDIILFSTEHLHTKKDGGQTINDTNLLTVQNDEKICIRSDILYYCKQMLAFLLINMNTQLE